MIKIWVDDERPTPDETWYRCKSVFDTIFLLGALSQLAPDDDILLDIDHDSGQQQKWGGDFIKILEYLEDGYHDEPNPVPFIKVHFHSANPVGVKNMRAIVEHCPWMEEVER